MYLLEFVYVYNVIFYFFIGFFFYYFFYGRELKLFVDFLLGINNDSEFFEVDEWLYIYRECF